MPQDAWSNKDERQYEHIRKSERERGRSRELDIRGRSSMRKDELIAAIREAQG